MCVCVLFLIDLGGSVLLKGVPQVWREAVEGLGGEQDGEEPRCHLPRCPLRMWLRILDGSQKLGVEP